jgi:4,5-dihydroxyphthalate decarboxylase
MGELGALAVSLPWLTRDLEELQATMGTDFWPQGFPANRAILQQMCTYSWEQGLLARPVPPEELFAEETLELEVTVVTAG